MMRRRTVLHGLAAMASLSVPAVAQWKARTLRFVP